MATTLILSIRYRPMRGNTRSCSLMVSVSSPKRGKRRPTDGREGFQNIFLRRGFSIYLVDQPRRGNAGRSTKAATIIPTFDEEVWFNRFRVGIWPNYFEGVQFSRDRETLEQYFRQMTPNIGPVDFEVYSDAYAALFEKTGPAIFIVHS